MNDKVNEKDRLLLSLRARIDQHLKFFDTLDRIRWQFTATFGVGAVAAIAFALGDKGSSDADLQNIKICVAALLVIVFSLAGAATQIRIAGLIGALWNNISNLQMKEFYALDAGNEASELENAIFPRPAELDKAGRRFRRLTVAIATYCLFSALSAIAVALICHVLWQKEKWLPIVAWPVVAFALVVLSLRLSDRYAEDVKSSIKETVDTTRKKSEAQRVAGSG